MTHLRDIRSDLKQELAFFAEISTEVTTESTYIIDTQRYSGNNIMFGFFSPTYNVGTFTPSVKHSDDSGMAGAVVIPQENIIGKQSDAFMNAQLAVGGNIKTFGVNDVKKYVRVDIVSAGGATGANIIVCIFTGKPTVLPQWGVAEDTI